MRPDIKVWNPENPAQWNKTLAWTTVWLSTFSLTLGFCAWFLVPSLAPRLNEIGFSLTHSQLYWLVAMVGLSAGTLRILWTFLPPILGTRILVTLSTGLLLIPLFCWVYAAQHPDTPYWMLICFALLSGIGGGTFSGLMASTNYFFPKHERGLALGIQGGLSDFGTGLVQFVTPLVIGFSAFAFLGDGQVAHLPDGKTVTYWLQNASWVWIPLVAIITILSWPFLRSVPVSGNVKQEWTIFGNKHTWFMTLRAPLRLPGWARLSAPFPASAQARSPIRFAAAESRQLWPSATSSVCLPFGSTNLQPYPAAGFGSS